MQEEKLYDPNFLESEHETHCLKIANWIKLSQVKQNTIQYTYYAINSQYRYSLKGWPCLAQNDDGTILTILI